MIEDLDQPKFEIDDIDIKIIQALIRNARADFKDIAEIVGVSDRTVARRIERLEKNRIIRGYYVDLDQEALTREGINLPEYEEYVKLSRLEWEELWNALGKIMGAGLGILLFHAGKAVGSEIGSKLINRYPDPEAALNVLPQMLIGRGCRECRLSEVDLEAGSGKLELFRQGITTQKNADIFTPWLRGLVMGALEAIVGEKVEVAEEAAADGGIAFRFSCSGEVRHGQLKSKDWSR